MIDHLVNKNKRLNEKGITFIIVLIMIVVLSILAVSVIGITSTNLNISSGERDQQSTYYIAEAAANVKLQEVRTSILEVYHATNRPTDFFHTLENFIKIGVTEEFDDYEFNETFGATPEATTIIELVRQIDFQTREYRLIADGTIGNRTRSTVTTFTVSWKDKTEEGLGIPEFAIYSYDLIDVQSGAARINGPVGLRSNNTVSNRTRNAITVGRGFVPVQYGIGVEIQLPPFPEFPTGLRTRTAISNNRITADGQYDTLLINGTVTVDVGNGNRVIRARNLNISGNLVIEGSGTLTIYVENETRINGNVNRGGRVDQVYIFDRGTNQFSISSGGDFVGSIYFNRADISLNGGRFTGHIFTHGTSVNMGGNAELINAFLFAPNATVSISGASSSGAVICRAFIAGGSGSVTHAPVAESELAPFFPQDPIQVTLEDLLDTRPVRER